MSDPTSRAARPNEGSATAASVATAVVLSLIVVAASFTLSFNALSELGAMSGAIPERLTWLLPVVIDVFILQATWCVYVATKRRDDPGKRYHFAMLAISSTVSVAGNAGHAFLASDQGVMHGLMAVSIAIVAPLALLASIHGLVMHVWAGGGATVHERTPGVEHGPVDSAPHAHSQVSAPIEAQSQPNSEQGDADTSPLSLTDLDAQITAADLELARLVCSRGRLRNDDRVVARVLVAERLRVHREHTANLTGVHRTTIGRWRDLAAECTADTSSLSERVHTADQPALVDAH